MHIRRTSHPLIAANGRRGMASVEIVLSMPLIMMMAALIYFLGDLNLKRADVLVRSRNDAWQARTQKGTPEVDPFPDQKKEDSLFVKPDSPTDGRQQFTDRTIKKPQSLYLIHTPLVTLAADHTVLGGSWDFHDLKACSKSSTDSDLVADKYVVADAFQGQDIDLSSLSATNQDQDSATNKIDDIIKKTNDSDPNFKPLNDAGKQLTDLVKQILNAIPDNPVQVLSSTTTAMSIISQSNVKSNGDSFATALDQIDDHLGNVKFPPIKNKIQGKGDADAIIKEINQDLKKLKIDKNELLDRLNSFASLTDLIKTLTDDPEY